MTFLCGSGEEKGEKLSIPELLARHNVELRLVLDRLVGHKWVVDKKKCKFFVKTVDFCGSQLS